MSTNHSITRLLAGVKEADEEAVHALFLKCYSRVADIGRRKLVNRPTRGFDEDDVANSAFIKLLKDAKRGKFEMKLENREDFWQIVTVLVADNIAKRLRSQRAKKRGGEGCSTESAASSTSLTSERAKKKGGRAAAVSLDEIPEEMGKLDDPTLETEIADAKTVFLSKLPSDEHRQVVELMSAGLTQEQIAAELDLSVRTIARRLDDIGAALPRILDVPDPRLNLREKHRN
jgi:RNA polymerase sigma factor (sigma-70 family)